MLRTQIQATFRIAERLDDIETAVDSKLLEEFTLLRKSLLEEISGASGRQASQAAERARALVRASCWERLHGESQKDLIFYALAEDLSPRMKAFALALALEREVREALRRAAVKVGDKASLRPMLEAGREDVNQRLRSMCAFALATEITWLRNRAAHAEKFDEDLLDRTEDIVFRKGLDGFGLLSNFVMLNAKD